VLLFTQFHFQPLDRLETYAQDMQMVLGAKTPVDTNLVLIGVDRTEYSSLFDDDEIKAEPVLASMQKSFPWPRSVWARLIEKLGDAGAKVIMLDFMFGSRGVDDDQLRAALDKYGQKTVIACNIHDLSSDRGDTLTIDWPNTSVLNYIPTNGGKFDDRFGYINIWPDEDGVVRSARYKLTGGKSADFIKEGSVLESFDAVALRKFGHPEAVPHDDEPVRFRYTRWAGQGYPAISVADVLGPKTWKSNFGNGAFFKDKIVLIGPTADIFQDYHKTPFPEKFGVVNGASYHYSSMMPGPEIHLNMIGAALHNTFIRQSPVETDICIIMLASLMASVLSYKIIQPVRRMLALVVLGAAYLHVTHLLYNHFNVLVQIASPLLVWFLSGILVLAYDYFVELFERTRVRRTLERYVSRNIVKELLENPDAHIHNEEGARMPVTVLFSDLRGFTTMTENADSAQLVRQLNEYFTEMVRVVFKYEGTLDKFIGDAVMAVWGNMLSEGPAQDARNARNAVSAALAMKQSLARLNADWQSRGIPPLAFGIGINHGEAISGNMGSHEKMEFTVIGDAVNTASRLEGLTKKFHLDLLIGETMAPLVKDHFLLRTVGLIQPKGKTIPATLYAVMGERGADVDAALEEWVKAYETAVAKYRARDFDGASGHFRECLKARPGDYLCEMYLAECEAFLKNPPAIDWNGVIVMTEK
jgi:adenylate cyclase